MNESWEESAACQGHPDPEIFFAEEDESPTSPRTKFFRLEQQARTEEAKGVCDLCPVQLECLEAALTSETVVFGVWGGTTTEERRGKKYARQRNHVQQRYFTPGDITR